MPAIIHIPLTKGKIAIIDAEDQPIVGHLRWYAHAPNGKFYARRTWSEGGRHLHATMHRVVMGAQPGDMVDHRNGDGLDNRRENLRLVTASQNSLNRKMRATNRSGYRGVSYREGTWEARISVRGEHFRLGTFDTPIEAALAYDRAAADLHGAFARLNFPHD